jgi:hypothetical protein
MGGACSTNGGEENIYRILVGKPEGERPLGRPSRGWVHSSKVDLREIGWDWIYVAEDRGQWRAVVNTVMNLRVPKKCWEVLEWLHSWWSLKNGSAP